MLIGLVKHTFGRLRRPTKGRFCIVSATRLTAEEFERNSLLGRALRKWPDCKRKVYFDNKLGLSTLYNRAIAEAAPSDVLIFVHDDVWFDQPDFFEQILKGLRRFDVLGIAGNTRLCPNHSAWLFNATATSEFQPDLEHASGSVLSGNLRQPIQTVFGAVPAACELLDGVFLAAKAKTLQRRQISFDERFEFHFYDLDFCRTCRSSGLTLGTWPLALYHESPGAFGSPSWRRARVAYQSKWSQG